jgi:ABC-type proline/glycine betaine transport system permease subunit
MVSMTLHSWLEIFRKVFVGITSVKPSRDFTRPLGMPKGLKGLLHTLNAIVSPTKEDLCFML